MVQCSGLSQELVDKHTELPDDIQWHFIGHLQSRKSKQLLGRPALSGVLSIVQLRLTWNHEHDLIFFTLRRQGCRTWSWSRLWTASRWVRRRCSCLPGAHYYSCLLGTHVLPDSTTWLSAWV